MNAHEPNGQTAARPGAGPVDEPTDRRAAVAFVARAALACALVIAGLLVVTAVFFAILAASGAESTDFSWVFAVYVLPSVVILTVLLFVATIVLGVVALVRGRGSERPTRAIAALGLAVLVVLVYVGWALVLAALLAPRTTG